MFGRRLAAKYQAHELVDVSNGPNAVLICKFRFEHGKYALFFDQCGLPKAHPWRTRCAPGGNREAVITPRGAVLSPRTCVLLCVNYE